MIIGGGSQTALTANFLSYLHQTLHNGQNDDPQENVADRLPRTPLRKRSTACKNRAPPKTSQWQLGLMNFGRLKWIVKKLHAEELDNNKNLNFITMNCSPSQFQLEKTTLPDSLPLQSQKQIFTEPSQRSRNWPQHSSIKQWQTVSQTPSHKEPVVLKNIDPLGTCNDSFLWTPFGKRSLWYQKCNPLHLLPDRLV